MNWQEFKDWLDPFLWGVIIGYLWNPVWQILKKIWHEARIAKEEWRKPNG
jgi:predicted PurR-regulated permease PerM